MPPLVSVIIPSYNRFSALEKAITSVKNQTYKNIEIIIVDDHSDDPSYGELCHSDNRVLYIKPEQSSRDALGFASPGYVRNIGLNTAKGEYIAFLDDDDYWFESKIERQLNFLITENAQFICSEALIGKGSFQESNKYRKMNQDHFSKFYTKYLKLFNLTDFPEKFNYEHISEHNCIITSSVVVRRDLVSEVGLFIEVPLRGITASSGKKIYEDWDFWLKCLKHCDCYFIKDPLLYYDGRIKKKGIFNKLLSLLHG